MKALVFLLLTCTAVLAMEADQPNTALPGSAWQVATFAGQTPLPNHPITFEFDNEGSIAGDASCNRFGGSCSIDGSKIKVGPLRCTRRACEPEIMQQERKFLALLATVTAWSVVGDELVLTAPDGEIRARRTTALSPQ